MKTFDSNESYFPKVGDIIYIESACYSSHGADDITGGRARVSKVEGDRLEVEQIPNRYFYWSRLASPMQEYLRERFKDDWAHRDPDLRPEFNKWD